MAMSEKSKKLRKEAALDKLLAEKINEARRHEDCEFELKGVEEKMLIKMKYNVDVGLKMTQLSVRIRRDQQELEQYTYDSQARDKEINGLMADASRLRQYLWETKNGI